MDGLTLVIPAPEHRALAEDFKREFLRAGEPVINGSALLDQMDYGPWLENVRRNRDPQTVRKDWVAASTFFALREGDGRLIGMVDIRHSLGTPFLAQYGGHIGYAVRPSERRKGYATAMLLLALDYARALGLAEVMLVCYSDNLASKKTILRCGGILAEEKRYTDAKPMEIYRIPLPSGSRAR